MTSSSIPRTLPAAGRLRWGPVLLVTAATGALVASTWLDLATTSSQRAVSETGTALSAVVPGIALVLAAAVVLHCRPGHTVGRLLAVVGLVWAVDGVLAAWATYGYAHDLPGTAFSFWYVARFGALLLSGVVWLIALYPTGGLVPGRSRPLGIAVLVASLTLPLALLLAPDSVVFARTGPTDVTTEVVTLPLTDDAWDRVLVVAQVLTLGSVVAAVGLLWDRHRRAGAEERSQVRWLLWAAIMCVLLVVVGATVAVGGPASTIALTLAVTTLAVSVTIGLVRPGLGDVDALVAWTLTSAAVAVVVVALDLVVLAAASAALGERLDERRVTILVLALAVVAYGPLRSWLGAGVRRLLFGRRGDRYGAVSSLAARLETTGSVAEQLPALARAVADTFKMGHVRVEVVAPDDSVLSASHGTPPPTVQEIDIAYGGERIGRLALPAQGLRAMLSGRDQGLLVDLVRQAAVAIRASLLATEVQESRERLVLGREEDRRRIRRDLHDGLGPALGGVALRLDAAGNAVATDPERAAELVRLARTEVRDALDDVRRLVHDLRPPALDDLGLEAALRQQAERLRPQLPVSVEASGLQGLPAAVEVAAYRIVSEALTNAVRHSGAAAAAVRLEGGADRLVVTVADDGCGIAEDVSAGVGLLSMRERAEELGGQCEVRCPDGGGTTVRAVLPYGAGIAETGREHEGNLR